MSISANDVKVLRERTGCGMMDCKKALTEAGGDMEKAVELLREKGLAAAAKKASRIAAEGLVEAYKQGDTSVLVEVNAETDFVAKNDDFKGFVLNTAKTVAQHNPEDVDQLLDMECVDGGGKTVKDILTEKIATIGENMSVRRFERYQGITEQYIHGGGRIGVMILFDLSDADKANEPAFAEYKKDVALQIAALNPQYVSPEEVPAEVVDKEKEILTAQAINEGKPANIAEKMVAGRIQKFYKEVCLLEQPFVKDDSTTVGGYTKDKSKELGADIKVIKFVRFEKGEGLQKREDNFAEEVANMVK